jgi:replicative DNA helicase
VFNSTDKALAMAVEELLLTLGQRPHLAEFQATGFGKTVTAYAVEFTPREIEPFRLPRKAEKATQTTKSLTYPSRRLIKSVEPGPDVETACIAVDSYNNTYLCSERMIPTHNSGVNAVKYPRSTSVQLALYANAPMISNKITIRGKDKVSIDDWRELPHRMDRTRAYVLLVEQDAEIGTFHRIDIEHGWVGAQLALSVIAWRKRLNYGEAIALEVKPDEVPVIDDSAIDGYIDMGGRAGSVKEVKMLWKNAYDQGVLTPDVKRVLTARAEELGAEVKAAG